jgi:hypothetical protein
MLVVKAQICWLAIRGILFPSHSSTLQNVFNSSIKLSTYLGMPFSFEPDICSIHCYPTQCHSDTYKF